MRWGNFDFSFARPIKWLLALFGSEVIPIERAGIKSNKFTKGHRFLSKEKLQVDIADWDFYKNLLHSHYVILEVEERKAYTRKTIEELSKSYGKVIIEESLLDENANLVEFPFPIIGKFPEKFLNLPEKLVITALQEHQRYFYLVDENNRLLPYFIAVNNNKPVDERVVIRGHERVAKARLEDAYFYYERDLKEKLQNKIHKLKGMTYHIKAGSLYDKTLRIKELTKFLKEKLFPELSEDLVERAGYYSKVDLVTEVVKEFPSLQGYMGAHYLILEGEEEIGHAIYEQYLPTSKDETLPESNLGILLALADKLDHLTALIGAGEKISGEGDPYGLRRAAYGIIKILLGKKLYLDLEPACIFALNLLEQQGFLKNEEAFTEIVDFIKKRMEGEFLALGFSKNFIYSILNQPLNPYKNYLKLMALKEIYNQKEFQDLVILFKRITQILKNTNPTLLPQINPEHFEEEMEYTLFQKMREEAQSLKNLDLENNFSGYLIKLLSFKRIIDEFFEKVYVMVEDKKIRENRLSLLYQLSLFFYNFGDLSYLA